MPNIVPFGKYIGQPIEAMQQDTAYVEWLLRQDWFPTKYAKVHTLVINNFGEPSETPEHNALQARFTDDDWISDFVWSVVGRDWWKKYLDEQIQKSTEEFERVIRKLQSELAMWEKHAPERAADTNASIDKAETEYAKRLTWMECGLEVYLAIENLTFEERGVDVLFSADVKLDGSKGVFADFHLPRFRFRVECKPSLSDDYPAVLRQIRSHPKEYGDLKDVLLIGSGGYTGVGATFAQVNKIFNSAGVEIVLLSRVGVLEGDVDAD